MAEVNTAKAKQLYDEAQKKVDKIERAFIQFGSKSDKYDDAGELYTKAAKLYQLAKNWECAGNSFLEAATCYLRSTYGKYNASTSYVHAANCFAKDNKLTNAIPVMLKGIEILAEDGKFGQAAKYEKEIAEMFEQLVDIDNAMKHYELAADYYENEGSTVTGSTCLLKVAHLAADKKDYHKAIDLFEKAANACTGLARHSVKEYYLKSGILYLCLGDVVAATNAVDKWTNKVPEFSGTREHKFLVRLIEAVSNVDVDEFKAAVGEWDSISKLDGWKQGLLMKVMESIDEEDLT